MPGMTKEEGIKQVYSGGGHVVILGAGASIASVRTNPEKNGKELPSMENLIDIVGLNDLLDDLSNDIKTKNFELLYSKLYEINPQDEKIKEIENRVYEYFNSLELPDAPTIYDYLVMSLRSKDIIATFNWDPFLYQAWSRNLGNRERPFIAFLHGNVAIGYSAIEKNFGPAGMHVKKTGNYLDPTKLLYPITHKNYQDEFIKSQWNLLRDFLADKNTKRLTIFGYSAPESDTEAKELLKSAWKQIGERNEEENERADEQLEVIDIKTKEEVMPRWKEFTYSHHFDYLTSYFKSSLAKNPRRTSESYFSHYFPFTTSEAFRSNNPIPENFSSMDEFWKWHEPLINAEKLHELKSQDKTKSSSTKNNIISKRRKRKKKKRMNKQIDAYWKRRKKSKRTRIKRHKKKRKTRANK